MAINFYRQCHMENPTKKYLLYTYFFYKLAFLKIRENINWFDHYKIVF